MSSNYNLQEGKDWILNSISLFFESIDNPNISPDSFQNEVIMELYTCSGKNQGVFGCEFKSEEEVQKYCDSKNDCIGYLKGFDDEKKINTYVPTKKLPIKNKIEGLIGEVSFYKKQNNLKKTDETKTDETKTDETKNKILGMDKMTFYILLIVVLMIISFIYMTN
jgi:hypothetical protein